MDDDDGEIAAHLQAAKSDMVILQLADCATAAPGAARVLKARITITW